MAERESHHIDIARPIEPFYWFDLHLLLSSEILRKCGQKTIFTASLQNDKILLVLVPIGI